MNQNRSLTDEKQALLAKMQASRVAYRRMLLGVDAEQTSSVVDAQSPDVFPKSNTVRWIRDHPYLIVLGVAAAVLASRRAPRQAVQSAIHRGRAATSTFVRNQNKIRTAIGIATAVARFIERRRHR